MKTFSQYLEARQDRVLILMRGISGTGKSARAREFAGENQSKIYSTDDFWGDDPDEYIRNFDPERLQEAHQWNQKRAIEAMKRGETPVIIDNMHLESHEARPYVQAANRFGYKVRIEEPSSNLWKSLKPMLEEKHKYGAELQEMAKELAARNLHGVPEEVILDMLHRWEPNISRNSILRSRAPWEE